MSEEPHPLKPLDLNNKHKDRRIRRWMTLLFSVHWFSDGASLCVYLTSTTNRLKILVQLLTQNNNMSVPTVKPIVILGGGMSGLACTFYLSKLPESVLRGRKIVLIEKETSAGGWVKSHVYSDNVVHELGPRSIRTAGLVGTNTLNLVCVL